MSDFTTHFITAHRFLKKKNLSDDFRRSFYLGVQGPDFLFYADLFGKKPETLFGSTFHKMIPKEFFEKGIDLVKSEEDDRVSGYLYGLMLHFIGDMLIHPYIGYLEKHQNPTNFKYIHMLNEAEIDYSIYEMEFSEKIKNFNVKEFYQMDEEMVDVIYKVWNTCQGYMEISKKIIKGSYKRLIFLSNNFAKSNKVLYFFAKILQPYKGVFTCHFKNHENKAVLNLEKNQWYDSNLSVPEILEETMSLFEKEINKFEDHLMKKSTYEFTHNLNFNGE